MRHLLAVLLLLGLPGAAARADQGAYIIDRFHTDLTVRPDGDLIVEERIDVTFSEPRHGLYRTIPVRYTDPRGYEYSFHVVLLGATDDHGAPYGTSLRSQGRYLNLRLGDADRTVMGPTVYVLRYRVRGALGHFPDFDEIYWNATGNEWNTPMAAASATVHLPAQLPADSLRIAAYTGAYGSQERNVSVSASDPGTIRFESQVPLAALEGLTIAVAWPRGYVKVPGPGLRAARFFADNWILLAPLAVFAFLWRQYRRRGRDPEGTGSIAVRYEPPPGVTAGGVGSIVDERVDLRDITATVVDLAVHGYLVIRVEERKQVFGLLGGDTTVFERRAEGDASKLLPHERKVLDALFESGDTVDVSNLRHRFYRHLPGIRETLDRAMVEQGYFAGKPASVRNRYVGFGVLAAVLVGIAGLVWASIRGGIMPYALGVPGVSGVLTALLFFAFAPAMPRRTKAGVELRRWALGFQEFVNRVEKENLEAAQARNAFETLLPYAMALGVAGAWARKFEGIYAAGGNPMWYSGPHLGPGFSTLAFESNLSHAMSQAGQGMAAAPRSQGSSGSGGGGFSGGGGGGGGGGSW